VTMVDYSRWNNLDASDDDDEGMKKPRVQAFKGPQKVTIGGHASGGGVHVRPSGADNQPVGVGEEAADEDDDEPMEPPSDDEPALGEDRREDVLNLRGLAERALRNGDAAEAVRILEKAMRFGGSSCPGLADVLAIARRAAAAAPTPAASSSSLASPSDVGAASAKEGRATDEAKAAHGGTVEGRYSWSQTRETVEVNIFVPEATKAKAVNRVRVTEEGVQVDVSGSPVLKGDWEFKVEPEEDPDWEVRSLEGRHVLRLTIRKQPLPGGLSVVVWWRRVLKGDPAIDISVADEKQKERADKFSKAWTEAHAAFRDKVAQRTPISIDCSAEGGGADSMETS